MVASGPFGEWAHGVAAKRDYYSALFETENRATVRLFLEVLGWPNRRRWVAPGDRRGRLPGERGEQEIADLAHDNRRSPARKLGKLRETRASRHIIGT